MYCLGTCGVLQVTDGIMSVYTYIYMYISMLGLEFVDVICGIYGD